MSDETLDALLREIEKRVWDDGEEGEPSPSPAAAMSRDDLLAGFKAVNDGPGNMEQLHMRADALLLRYINDREVWDAFLGIPKWYA